MSQYIPPPEKTRPSDEEYLAMIRERDGVPARLGGRIRVPAYGGKEGTIIGTHYDLALMVQFGNDRWMTAVGPRLCEYLEENDDRS